MFKLLSLRRLRRIPPPNVNKKARNELKVHQKHVRAAVKQDISPDLHHLDYPIWGVLENKTNVTSHPNIGSLKTVIEEEWNKMSEELILKAYKSIQRHVDIIIKKMLVILNKFTILYLSSNFAVYFFKLKLILFCNRVLNYDSRIFLILPPHPVNKLNSFSLDLISKKWKAKEIIVLVCIMFEHFPWEEIPPN